MMSKISNLSNLNVFCTNLIILFRKNISLCLTKCIAFQIRICQQDFHFNFPKLWVRIYYSKLEKNCKF